MTIGIIRYIDITSAVAGTPEVRNKDLGGRIFTQNPLVPLNGILVFNSLEAVGNYFGTGGTEYAMAQFYFGWISPLYTRAKQLSFARWSDVATAPEIIGASITSSLVALKAITAGTLSLTLGNTTASITGIDFSSAADMNAIAAILQTEIRTTGTGTNFTSATVTYNSANNIFVLEGGQVGPAVINITAGTPGIDVAPLIGWFPKMNSYGVGAIWNDGVAAQSVAQVLDVVTNADNNFGSFLFDPPLNTALIKDAAEWTDAQDIQCIYCVPVNPADAAEISDDVKNYGGVALTLSKTPGEFPEMVPMTILGAIDYTKVNASINYMFRQFDLTPSVSDDATADTMDSLLINYYGQTQDNGQKIAFYQRGILCGPDTQPSDMNVFGNEIWLKDAIATALLNLFLVAGRVPANQSGEAKILIMINNAINQALINGVISVGKALTVLQKSTITEISGDELAWHQVETKGYWVTVRIDQVINEVTQKTEYCAFYTLIYSKDDMIRKVVGRDILI